MSTILGKLLLTFQGGGGGGGGGGGVGGGVDGSPILLIGALLELVIN